MCAKRANRFAGSALWRRFAISSLKRFELQGGQGSWIPGQAGYDTVSNPTHPATPTPHVRPRSVPLPSVDPALCHPRLDRGSIPLADKPVFFCLGVTEHDAPKASLPESSFVLSESEKVNFSGRAAPKQLAGPPSRPRADH